MVLHVFGFVLLLSRPTRSLLIEKQNKERERERVGEWARVTTENERKESLLERVSVEDEELCARQRERERVR